MTNWKKVLLDNEDAIREAMEESYRKSIVTRRLNSGWSEQVFIDNGGDVWAAYMGQNEFPAEVFNGNAICVASFQEQGIYDTEWVKADEFWEWLEENYKEEYDAADDDIDAADHERYDEYCDEMRDAYLDDSVGEAVDYAWDDAIEEAERNEEI